MENIDLFNTRSFYFEVRDNQLIEIPVVEYIYNFNQFIKSLIRQIADPQNIYEELQIKIFHEDQEETIFLNDANLQQSIIVATYLGITEPELLSNNNSITVLATTGDNYMFDINVLENLNDSIMHSFAKLIVEAHELGNNDIAHLFLPHWLKSNLASSILEIAVDIHYGPTIAVIDLNHPRRREIEQMYC
jgi:hypothetical protein